MAKNPTVPGHKVRSPIIGRWRITEMEQWDRDYCDMEVPAFIEFRPDGLGEFQFGLVSGDIDHWAGSGWFYVDAMEARAKPKEFGTLPGPPPRPGKKERACQNPHSG